MFCVLFVFSWIPTQVGHLFGENNDLVKLNLIWNGEKFIRLLFDELGEYFNETSSLDIISFFCL